MDQDLGVQPGQWDLSKQDVIALLARALGYGTGGEGRGGGGWGGETLSALPLSCNYTIHTH